jgi:hypothetical protein
MDIKSLNTDLFHSAVMAALQGNTILYPLVNTVDANGNSRVRFSSQGISQSTPVRRGDKIVPEEQKYDSVWANIEAWEIVDILLTTDELDSMNIPSAIRNIQFNIGAAAGRRYDQIIIDTIYDNNTNFETFSAGGLSDTANILKLKKFYRKNGGANAGKQIFVGTAQQEVELLSNPDLKNILTNSQKILDVAGIGIAYEALNITFIFMEDRPNEGGIAYNTNTNARKCLAFLAGYVNIAQQSDIAPSIFRDETYTGGGATLFRKIVRGGGAIPLKTAVMVIESPETI